MPAGPTREAPPGQSKAEARSEPFLRITLLECGHGDTILLRFPGPRWVLIDCHLRSGETRAAFFDLVKKEKITRLDLLFLTHPHADHYWGMADIVDHFTRDGRSIGFFCDIGVSHVDVVGLLDAQGVSDDEVTEYVRFMKRIDPLLKDRTVGYTRVDENTRPMYVGGLAKQVAFFPIGPEPRIVTLATRRAAAGERVEESPNAFSMVLVLQSGVQGQEMQVLLGADVETSGMDRTLDIWKKHDANNRRSLEFDCVKVPHHGSKEGHSERLCAGKRRVGDAVAAISVGTRFRRSLPNRTVVKDYLDHGWTVLSTTTRRGPSKSDRLITQFGRSDDPPVEFARHDVQIEWRTPTVAPAWKPAQARIVQADLQHYAEGSGC